MMDELAIDDVRTQLTSGNKIVVKNITKGIEIPTIINVSDRQKDMLLAGGLLNYTRENN